MVVYYSSRPSCMTLPEKSADIGRLSLRTSIDSLVTKRMQVSALERWTIKQTPADLEESCTSFRSSDATYTNWEDSVASFNSMVYGGSSFFGNEMETDPSNDKTALDARLRQELQSKLSGGTTPLKVKKKKQQEREWLQKAPICFSQKRMDGMKVVKTNGSMNRKHPVQDLIGAFRNHMPQVPIKLPRKNKLYSAAA